MKVAHLDTGRTWRGGQQQVLLLARGLERAGHRNLLLAPEGPLAERARDAGLDVVRWTSRGELDLAAVAAAAAVLRRAAPDVVHAHSAHAHALGVPAARLAGVRAVVVSRRVDFAVARTPWSRVKYALPVDRYLCISRGVRDVMRAGGVDARRLALVPSGVEIPDPAALARERETAADLRALIDAPPGAPVVGTVAALAPHKDHATLLEAASRVVAGRPEVRFAWLGEGECRADLERRRAELGLGSHVHLLGFRADARALIQQFTVFALSSHLEGLCTSLLDAGARGVPIVATAVGGVPDIVRDGETGRVVPARDPEALARALLDALADPAGSAARAADQRAAVAAFSVDALVANTLRVYREVLEERGAKADTP